MKFLAWVGSHSFGAVRRWIHLATLLYSIVVLSLRPSTWRRTVRQALVRQVVFSGVEGMGFTAWVAAFVGIGVVVQAQFWFGRLGQTAVVGPLLVTVIVRELGPLLANLIAIQRSGN